MPDSLNRFTEHLSGQMICRRFRFGCIPKILWSAKRSILKITFRLPLKSIKQFSIGFKITLFAISFQQCEQRKCTAWNHAIQHTNQLHKHCPVPRTQNVWYRIQLQFRSMHPNENQNKCQFLRHKKRFHLFSQTLCFVSIPVVIPTIQFQTNCHYSTLESSILKNIQWKLYSVKMKKQMESEMKN